MGYHIDLQKISIESFKSVLKSADLLKSWMLLKENIDENLDVIIHQDIHNLHELKQVLKSNEQLLHFSKRSGLSEAYLKILRRVVNGYQPKPNRIQDFPETSTDVIEKLKKEGIKNTLHIYNKVQTTKDRKLLSIQTGISEKDINRLTRLADLSRIRWVNHTFAYVLYEAGYDSVEKMTLTNPQTLYETVKQLNAKRNIYKAHIGVHDMKLCIEFAKKLTLDIQYDEE